ncbi:MAG: MerR family transcriptional regulator [Peptostreptococcaceae bacterium]|nr:MerR family transcriptional regulator [Peptostreptococcaceae bacterium]
MKRNYTVGEIAKNLGVSRDTVRYYENMGIVSSRKNERGYRFFTREDVVALFYVINLKQLRISLKDIHFMLNESTLEDSISIVKNQEKRIREEIEKMQNCLGVIKDYRLCLEKALKYCDRMFVETCPPIIYKEIVNEDIFEVFRQFQEISPNHNHILSFLIEKHLFQSRDFCRFNQIKHEFVPIISMIDDEKQEQRFLEQGFLLYRPSRCIHAVVESYANQNYESILKVRDEIMRSDHEITGPIMWRSLSLRNLPDKIHDYHELWIPIAED